MNFDFTVLGSGAAAPTKDRNPSAFLIHHHKKIFLIDCGEGTQMQFLRYNIKFQRINEIFISHLHGDHFFGLVGLISTLHLLGRMGDLHIYCPEELENIILQQLKVSNTTLRFKLIFHYHNYSEKSLIYENSHLYVYSFPLNHSVNCCGFIFEEKPKTRKLLKEKLPTHLNLEQISLLLDGKDIIDNDKNVIFKNYDLTSEPKPSRKFSYCSDSRVDDEYAHYIQKSTLMYHETTFLIDLVDRAKATMHSTSVEVGKFAKQNRVHKLIIGHFSARYKNLSNFIAEIKPYFEQTLIAEEGKTYKIE